MKIKSRFSFLYWLDWDIYLKRSCIRNFAQKENTRWDSHKASDTPGSRRDILLILKAE